MEKLFELQLDVVERFGISVLDDFIKICSSRWLYQSLLIFYVSYGVDYSNEFITNNINFFNHGKHSNITP